MIKHTGKSLLIVSIAAAIVMLAFSVTWFLVNQLG
jgi:hypothetical protein